MERQFRVTWPKQMEADLIKTAMLRLDRCPVLDPLAPELFGLQKGFTGSQGLVRHRFRFPSGLFVERGHRTRLRHVDRVTASDLDDCRTRALGHETLSLRWDHFVIGSNQVLARLGYPSRLADRAVECVHAPWDLRVCHELRLFIVHVTRE